MVERDLAGVRLHDLLSRSRPDVHRGEIRQLISCGGVSVNGEVCLHDRKLHVGDVVLLAEKLVRSAPAGRTTTSAAASAPRVLVETDSAIVVNKPALLPSAAGSSSATTALAEIQKVRPDEDLRVVRRLDRQASGCLVLAKGLDASRHLEQEHREGRLQEGYVALVTGVPAQDEQDIVAFLGPDRRRPGMVQASAKERSGFREARTTVVVRARFARHALLELRPATSRGHQLRVHLASVGHSIVCDQEYGGERLLLSRLKPDYKMRPGVTERPLLQRMFLHAERVAFVDADGDNVVAEAPMPEDLSVALRHVEKHTSTRRT